MSENRELSHHGHEENDEESDMIYTTWLHEEDDDSADDSSDSKKALHKPWKIKRDITTKPTVNLAAAVSIRNTIDMIDTFDRPADAIAEGTYVRSGTYAIGYEDEPGKRIPKAGAFAKAGVGRAHAEPLKKTINNNCYPTEHRDLNTWYTIHNDGDNQWIAFEYEWVILSRKSTPDAPEHVFEAEAKGPNASAGAEASVVGAGAMARAELASVSAKAGPVSAKLGLGIDTGVSAGVDGVEVKFLGTGFSIGPKTSISLLNSEVSCSVM